MVFFCVEDAIESTDALQSAAAAAHQLELKKKLDEGRENSEHVA